MPLENYGDRTIPNQHMESIKVSNLQGSVQNR